MVVSNVNSGIKQSIALLLHIPVFGQRSGKAEQFVWAGRLSLKKFRKRPNSGSEVVSVNNTLCDMLERTVTRFEHEWPIYVERMDGGWGLESRNGTKKDMI